MKYILVTPLYILLFTGSLTGNGLKWVRVNVPQYRVPGETAQLQCDFHLGNDTLYSVKWYKDQEEFYRFVPKSIPAATSYEIEGVHVDMTKSNSKKVVLSDVNWRTSGVFRCEVSAEAPSFSSSQSEARMEIVSFPEDDPIITGINPEYAYEVGNEINLNCTSGQSRPASTLFWYVNEQQIKNDDALTKYPTVIHSKGLLTSTLGLRLKLDNRHFLGGSMKIKCLSSITPVFFGSEDSEIVSDEMYNAMRDRRETLSFIKSISIGSTREPTIYLFILYVVIYIIMIC